MAWNRGRHDLVNTVTKPERNRSPKPYLSRMMLDPTLRPPLALLLLCQIQCSEFVLDGRPCLQPNDSMLSIAPLLATKQAEAYVGHHRLAGPVYTALLQVSQASGTGHDAERSRTWLLQLSACMP